MPDDALLSSPALMLEISRLAPPGYRSHRRRRFYPYGERRAFYFHMGADEESAPEQSVILSLIYVWWGNFQSHFSLWRSRLLQVLSWSHFRREHSIVIVISPRLLQKMSKPWTTIVEAALSSGLSTVLMRFTTGCEASTSASSRGTSVQVSAERFDCNCSIDDTGTVCVILKSLTLSILRRPPFCSIRIHSQHGFSRVFCFVIPL